MRWHAKTYYYFLHRCRNSEQAKELVQTTFIKLWQCRASLKPEYPFETQLFNITSSVWIDWLRQQARHKNRLTVLSDELPDSPSSHPVLQFENNDHIEAVLLELPPMRRKVFELHRMRGYSYKEIAEMLTISVKTVDNHMSQAVKQLKAIMTLLIFCFLH